MHNIFSRTHVIFPTTYGPLHPGLLCATRECRGHGTCRALHQTGGGPSRDPAEVWAAEPLFPEGGVSDHVVTSAGNRCPQG